MGLIQTIHIADVFWLGGQIKCFAGRILHARGQFKASTLTNAWENVLQFHDGRTDSLEDAVRDISKRVGVSLSDDDAKALVEYLKTL